jgi:hypothetical protein
MLAQMLSTAEKQVVSTFPIVRPRKMPAIPQVERRIFKKEEAGYEKPQD